MASLPHTIDCNGEGFSSQFVLLTYDPVSTWLDVTVNLIPSPLAKCAPVTSVPSYFLAKDLLCLTSYFDCAFDSYGKSIEDDFVSLELGIQVRIENIDETGATIDSFVNMGTGEFDRLLYIAMRGWFDIDDIRKFASNMRLEIERISGISPGEM